MTERLPATLLLFLPCIEDVEFVQCRTTSRPCIIDAELEYSEPSEEELLLRDGPRS